MRNGNNLYLEYVCHKNDPYRENLKTSKEKKAYVFKFMLLSDHRKNVSYKECKNIIIRELVFEMLSKGNKNMAKSIYNNKIDAPTIKSIWKKF